MILHKLYTSPTFFSLEKGLDASDLRQKVIADNLANVNTPHYKRKRVSFETELRRAFEQRDRHYLKGFDTHPTHLPINPRPHWDEITPDVYKERHTIYRNDGNNVDIDLEMAEEAKNTQQYLTLSRMMQRRFTGLKDLIKAGAR